MGYVEKGKVYGIRVKSIPLEHLFILIKSPRFKNDEYEVNCAHERKVTDTKY